MYIQYIRTSQPKTDGYYCKFLTHEMDKKKKVIQECIFNKADFFKSIVNISAMSASVHLVCFHLLYKYIFMHTTYSREA